MPRSASFPLFIIPPVLPDFHTCNEYYGTPGSLDCHIAANALPYGVDPEPWNPLPFFNSTDFVPTHEANGLPFMVSHGDCEIVIDLAGPANFDRRNAVVWGTPNDFRGMAGWVISQCVDRIGFGGFITKGIANTMNFMTSPNVNFWNFRLYPPDTSFFTVKVTDTREETIDPGDQDPSTGLQLYSNIIDSAIAAPPGPIKSSLISTARTFMGSIYKMRRDISNPPYWWEWYSGATGLNGQMMYTCDANLGGPSLVDCSKIEYSQLGAPSDTITVESGSATFLNSQTCVLAISASVTTTISWQQIREALDMLINVCVGNPTSPSVGGRAYLGVEDALTFKKEKERKRDGDGANANAYDPLPAHANITLFQQFEGFVNSTRELLSCSWQHVLLGQNVRTCGVVHGHLNG